MRKIKFACCYTISLTVFIISCCTNGNSALLEVKKLNNYPSASGVEYLDGQLFVMGDDANDLLILDTNFTVKNSISLYHYPEKRIPKDTKPDLEAIASHTDNTGSVIFLFGSGSLPQRSMGWWYYLQTKIKDSISLVPLFTQIKNTGIDEINIEGACFIPGYLILTNRGNKAFRKNHLVFVEERFWDKETSYAITTALIDQQYDSLSFPGISGATYSSQSDRLILTVSTEDTRSSFEDGAIGKSYLWIVKNISSRKNQTHIRPDQIVDLETISDAFKAMKVESACITAETKSFIYLVLAADNDDGSSTLFKIRLKKG